MLEKKTLLISLECCFMKQNRNMFMEISLSFIKNSSRRDGQTKSLIRETKKHT